MSLILRVPGHSERDFTYRLQYRVKSRAVSTGAATLNVSPPPD